MTNEDFYRIMAMNPQQAKREIQRMANPSEFEKKAKENQFEPKKNQKKKVKNEKIQSDAM